MSLLYRRIQFTAGFFVLYNSLHILCQGAESLVLGFNNYLDPHFFQLSPVFLFKLMGAMEELIF